MKKFITVLFALILMSVSLSAQNWQSGIIPADELKGTPEYSYHIYQDPDTGNAFVFWSNSPQIKIVKSRGIFDYETVGRYSRSKYLKDVLIGFYDKDGNLMSKTSTSFRVDDKDADEAYHFNAQGVIDHLKTTGPVRIIASSYSGPDFDLTIEMISDSL